MSPAAKNGPGSRPRVLPTVRRAKPRPRRRGLEGLVIAALLLLIASCAGGAKPHKLATAKDGSLQLSPAERELVTAWRSERGLSEGDAISNVMLRRYASAGHKVRYAGEGLYEVMDRPAGREVVATFYIEHARK